MSAIINLLFVQKFTDKLDDSKENIEYKCLTNFT